MKVKLKNQPLTVMDPSYQLVGYGNGRELQRNISVTEVVTSEEHL